MSDPTPPSPAPSPTQSGPLSTDDIAAHDEHDHIAAVFAGRDDAESAVDELRSLGLGSEHLGVAVHGSDTVVFEHDTEAETLHGVGVSGAIGVPIGFLAGLALTTLAVPGLAVGGILALAGVGAGWGGFLGSYLGLAVAERSRSEHEDIAMTPLQPGEVLIVVCSHGHADTVRQVMQRHHGRVPSAGTASRP